MAKERPILFSGPMVRALLEGRKTQTRRVIKPTKEHPEVEPDGIYDLHPGDIELERCRYGHSGDWLWVREAFSLANGEDGPMVCYRADTGRRYLMHEDRFLCEDGSFNYAQTPEADFSVWCSDVEGSDKGWKPSIHMPRWASRIQLQVTGVRIERLQDISSEDVMAEGCFPIGDGGVIDSEAAVGAFSGLWNSINGPESWDANPWVWVVEFKKVKP